MKNFNEQDDDDRRENGLEGSECMLTRLIDRFIDEDDRIEISIDELFGENKTSAFDSDGNVYIRLEYQYGNREIVLRLRDYEVIRDEDFPADLRAEMIDYLRSVEDIIIELAKMIGTDCSLREFLDVKVKLIARRARLWEQLSFFDRNGFARGQLYYIHCFNDALDYDCSKLYRYSGLEFVTDDGKVLNYSHVLDMELYEWAHVSIAKFTTDPKFERLHGFIEMMYIYLDEFPEHKIRSDADGNVTLSVRGAQLTIPFDEINDPKFEDADEAKHWQGLIMRRLIANAVRVETPPPSTHHIIRIDEFKLRDVLTNVHRPRKLLLDTIYHTDRRNVYRVQLMCKPVDNDHAYVYLVGEISSVEEPWELKLSVPFIDPDEMSAITYPITTKWRALNFYPSDADELPIDRFEKYLERAKGRVEDFLVNFAGLDRGVEITL